MSNQADIEAMQRRVQTIEESQAFDQRAIEVLSEEVRALGERLDGVVRRLAMLEERLRRATEQDRDSRQE